MKLLITGGMGYIGTTLISHLQEHDIDVVDNFYYKQYKVLDKVGHLKFNLIQKDCREITDYSQYDMILPLAAYVGFPRCDIVGEKETYSLNYEYIKDLCGKLSHQQSVIFYNTNSSYGSVPDGICTEDTPRKGLSSYALSKDMAEDVVLQKPNGMAFRLATVCGVSPRQRVDLLFQTMVYDALVKKEISIFDPQYRRNFLGLNDLCRATVFGINNWTKTHNGVFNLGNDSLNTSKGDLAQRICNKLGATYKIISGVDKDARDYEISSKKFAKLGFKWKQGFDQLVNEMTAFYQNNDIKEWMRNA